MTVSNVPDTTKLGRATSYRASSDKIIDFKELSEIRRRHPDMTIAQCHGVFDLLHAGHLAYFQSAKKHGELLVVTITADEFVNKGPGRPHFNAGVRATMIAALEIVDYVAISHFKTAVPTIEALKPDFYIKGPDYKNKAADITGGILQEEEAVTRVGGRSVYTDDATHSSSNLINRFFSPWTKEQEATIRAVNEAGGYEVICQVLDRVSKLRPLIIGEPIVDTYVFCTPEAISSKGSAISCRHDYEEDYAGGSLAIANHLADFTTEPVLLFTHGGEEYFKNLLADKLDSRVKLVTQILPGIPTPRKIRYMAENKIHRLFEITHLRSDQWMKHSSVEFCKLIGRSNKETDCTILADFGHGLFEGQVLSSVLQLEGFVGLNVQTNSSNYAFNLFTKHNRFSYLGIDTKEARLACHDRHTEPLEVARMIKSRSSFEKTALAMTLGSAGSAFFPAESSNEELSPAFAYNVVDPIGAGDAFFALTSLLIKVGCPDVMVPFLGNVFAGLKTKIVGNKSAVSRVQLMKSVEMILK